jgi:predicted SAM-dependent methyltransferase
VPDVTRLKDYLSVGPGSGADYSAFRAFVSNRVKPALSLAMKRSSRAKARRLMASGVPLRLHIGCGPVYKEGWVNMDLARPGWRLDLVWDLRWGLPFDDGTVDAIFSEHLFEHLPWAAGLSLLRHCHRVLRSGGGIRVGVPDLQRYVLSYLEKDPLIDVCRPDRPTRAMALNEVFFGYGHTSMFDFATMDLLLRSAGFQASVHSSPGTDRLGAADTPGRAPETLYVEAIK